jgi:hypothetical protein
MVGCGKNSFSSKGSSSNSSDYPEVVLSPEHLDGIAEVLGTVIFDLVESVQGLNGRLDFSRNAVSYSQAYNCPVAGSVSLSAQAQFNASAGLTSGQAVLTTGNGSIVFQLCKVALPNGEILTLNGTLNLFSLSGALSGSWDLSGTGTFTGNANSAWNGNLQVQAGAFDKSCSFNGAFQANGSGSLNIIKETATGNFTLNLNGQICDQNLVENLTTQL